MSTTADGRSAQRMTDYANYWQKDTLKEADVDTDNRTTSYKDVVNGYYDGATELYEYGWAQSFHFSRFYKGESFTASLARHEHYLAHNMRLRPGMRVLDVGCGVGGPAREIARFADVHVVGINNNEFQVQRARKYAKQAGLADQVEFVKGDFMTLAKQFGENSFDAVYAIEATVHAPSLQGIYDEIKKVLKPGGVFGLYEWAMTPRWDPSNPLHKSLAHEIEFGNGIPSMRPTTEVHEALLACGYDIEVEEDLAERPDPIEWYYPLEGDIKKAQTLWDYFTVARISPTGRFLNHKFMWLLETFGVMPKGTHGITIALDVAAESLVKAGQLKIFTPMYLVIAHKPKA